MDESATHNRSPSPWRVPSMPRRWQQFLVCCMFHFALPLLPLAAELYQDGKVGIASLTFGSAVYVMALGASSRNEAIFGISIVLGIVYTGLFGMLRNAANVQHPGTESAVKWSVLFVVLCHLGERFSRHVIDRAPYFEFMKTSGEPE